MPTLLLYKGLRFFFYSNENHEPVHVTKGAASGKIWLEPTVEEKYLSGFTRSEESDIWEILEAHAATFKHNGMHTSGNKHFDAIEQLFIGAGLRIEALDLHPDLDVMTIYLNTKVVLTQLISAYPLLKKASIQELLQYELIGDGTGIHWPQIDEDLSLKGFLQDELRKVVNRTPPVAA